MFSPEVTLQIYNKNKHTARVVTPKILKSQKIGINKHGALELIEYGLIEAEGKKIITMTLPVNNRFFIIE